MSPIGGAGGPREAAEVASESAEALWAAAAGPSTAGAPSGAPSAQGERTTGRNAAMAAIAARAQAKASAALPAWYPPPGYDLDKAAEAARAELVAQGEPAGSIGKGKADKLVFTDADLTFLKTSTPVLLKNKTTGELGRHPETGNLLLLGIGPERDQRKELGELRKQYPGVKWDDFGFDYREMDSIPEIMKTAEIEATTAELRASDRDARSRDFVITARPGENVAAGLERYLDARGIDPNGVFAVNSKKHSKALGLTDPDITSAQMKALAIAGLIKLYDPKESELKSVRFFDDGDSNLAAAMELLPKLFPHVEFEFIDVIHAGGGEHVHRTVALSDANITGYRSADAPFQADPRSSTVNP